MRPSFSWFSSRRLRRLALVALLPAGLLCAREDPVAVFAATFNGYARTRLPDKSFKPEIYTFGEGGCWTRPVRDPVMDQMTFLRVAQAAAAPLGRLNYRPARTAGEAELLILLFWGSTEGSRESVPFNDDPFRNQERDMLDARNARILGYQDALERAYSVPHMSFTQDALIEISDNRYYVVLQAYDFRTAVKERKLKPLWTARLSMREDHNNFARALDDMLRNGARYLGQDSKGLHRDINPETRVELGPMDIIGTLPDKK